MKLKKVVNVVVVALACLAVLMFGVFFIWAVLDMAPLNHGMVIEKKAWVEEYRTFVMVGKILIPSPPKYRDRWDITIKGSIWPGIVPVKTTTIPVLKETFDGLSVGDSYQRDRSQPLQ
ncbi:MAG: hypothetical protein WCW26_05530 [Candidatus Buchananbacteria bacterium]